MTSARNERQAKQDSEAFDADHLLEVLRELAVPPYAISRTTVIPFDHERHENDAEHSFSLGIVAMCIAPMIDSGLDLGLISQYALVHDLIEIYSGDTSVYAEPEVQSTKEQRELVAHRRLSDRFGADYPWLLDKLESYRQKSTQESNFVYALDKILPHAMVILGEFHPVKPAWERYQVTERIAKRKIETSYPALSPVFDELCHRYAARPYLFSTPPNGLTTAKSSARRKKD